MRRWASQGVKAQTCVTSPPYFGLRDYGYDGQIGLEQTPEQYIAAIVEVFRCVRDVLADDGALWLNLGDCYGAVGGNMLDPFMGSGTTAAVAIKHGRQYLGCELNPAYKELQDARIGAPKPTDLFNLPI